MGFSASILILHPYSQGVEGAGSSLRGVHTVWHVEEFIAFGRITRVSKLELPSRIGFGSKERAGMCAFSWIFRYLTERINRHTSNRGPRSVFAPPFWVSDVFLNEWQLEVAPKVLDSAVSELAWRGEVIQPRYLDFYRSVPDLRIMQEHNLMMGLDNKKFEGHIRDFHPINHAPLLWVPCRTLAEWLHEMEAGKTFAALELKKDRDALARMRAWRAYLEAFGNMRARALFYFEDVWG